MSSQGLLEAYDGGPDLVQVADTRHARRLTKRLLKRRGGDLRVVDPLGVLRQAKLDEAGAKRAHVAPARTLLRELAHRGDRDGVSDEPPIPHRLAGRIERKPPPLLAPFERAEVEPHPIRRLGGNDSHHLLARVGEGVRSLPDPRDLLRETHGMDNSPVDEPGPDGNALAKRTFRPIAETYDRYASLLSFGQDARWRRFLLDRVPVSPGARVLYVACGTGAISMGLAQRYGCAVVGVDLSPEMLAEARRRIVSAGLEERIQLAEARAEDLPFDDASFDAVTFGYLLRYVEDPRATLAELARVVRPGGRIAGLDFAVPPGSLPRAAWRVYVRYGLPALGALVSDGWRDVGRVLDRTIEPFHRRYPLARQLEDWRAAGVVDVRSQLLSLGGGVVVWGTHAS